MSEGPAAVPAVPRTAGEAVRRVRSTQVTPLPEEQHPLPPTGGHGRVPSPRSHPRTSLLTW